MNRTIGFLTWADQLFNAWLSEAASVGGVAALKTAAAELGQVHEALRWEAQAAAFAMTHERRQRIYAGPWCHVLADEGRARERASFWALVRETPHLDWMILMKDAHSALKALPENWGHGYGNVWIGAKATGEESVQQALRELRKVPARLRFLMTMPVLGDVGELDLSGIGWVLLNGAAGGGAESADWVASIKLQATYFGIPVWFETPFRVAVRNDRSLPLVVREQPRSPRLTHWMLDHAALPANCD
jgi:protein gp37